MNHSNSSINNATNTTVQFHQSPISQNEISIMEESLSVIRGQAFLMKQAMEASNIRDVLRYSSALVSELRTSALSPKKYYELYTHVYGELQHLHAYIIDRNRHKKRLADLYESVQHAGNVLPRMYLLITVAGPCIQYGEIPALDGLTDLNELCKGVQHPTRGLFLRHYLIQMFKDHLPDVGDATYPDFDPKVYALQSTLTTDNTSENNTVESKPMCISNIEVSFKFLYNNCVEATKLWIRLQFQVPAKDRARKEPERFALKILVGSNIFRMGQLKGITPEFYKNIAFPKLLEHLYNIHDVMAQQYLLECIVQAFRNECHIATLPELMKAICSVSSSVDLRGVFAMLFSRLKAFSLSAINKPVEKTGDSESETLPFILTTGGIETDRKKQSPEMTTTEPKSTASSVLPCSSHMNENKQSLGSPIDHQTVFPHDHIEEQHSLSSNNKSPIRTPAAKHDDDDDDDGSNMSNSNHLSYEGELVPPPPPSSMTKHELPSPLLLNESKKQSDNVSIQQQLSTLFVQIRAGLIQCIRKAHSEEYGASVPETSTKRSSTVSRLTLSNLLQILTLFLDFTVSVFPNRIDLLASVYQLVRPLVDASLDSPFMERINKIVQQFPPKIEDIEEGKKHATYKKISSKGKCLADIMALPMFHKGNLSLFHTEAYSELLDLLNPLLKLEVFRSVSEALVSAEEIISEPSCLDGLYRLALPTLQASSHTTTTTDLQAGQQSKEAYGWVSRLTHLIYNDDTDINFTMLCRAHEYLSSGDNETFYITMPSLVIKTLELLPRTQKRELDYLNILEKIRAEKINNKTIPIHENKSEPQEEQQLLQHDDVVKSPLSKNDERGDVNTNITDTLLPSSDNNKDVYNDDEYIEKQEELLYQLSSCSISPPAISSKRLLQFVHGVVTDMADWNAEIALRFMLLSAEAAALADAKQPGEFSAICCEFLRQAVICYEEQLTENKLRVKALTLLVGMVSTYSLCLDPETVEAMAEKLTRHAAKLLRKSEQCSLILQCTHLFWNENDPTRRFMDRVQECLQKCLKLVVGCLQYSPSDVYLFNDILEKYLFYFEQAPEEVPARAISSLISLCAEQITFVAGTSDNLGKENIMTIQRQFDNILQYIRTCQNGTLPIYRDIDIRFAV